MTEGGVSLNGGDRRRNDKSFFVYAKQRIRRLFRDSIVFDNIEDMYMYKKVVLVKPLDSET